jgi:hypothetical protein
MLDEMLLSELKEYVKKHMDMLPPPMCAPIIHKYGIVSENSAHIEIEDYIKNKRKPTFNQVLFSFIDGKGASDSEVYKRAGLDRRHFSKIRSNPDYRISKNTAIALVLALELDKKEADKLLIAAGYSLSENDTLDLVIQFCLEKKIYDMNIVNEALDYFSLKPLI